MMTETEILACTTGKHEYNKQTFSHHLQNCDSNHRLKLVRQFVVHRFSQGNK